MSTDMLSYQFQYTQQILKGAAQGVTHEESLKSPTDGGNCLNWVLGHVLTARNGTLTVLGKEPIWDEETTARYQRGSQPLAADEAVELSTLLDDLDRSHEKIVEGLGEISSETMEKPAPFSPANNPKETVGSLLAVMTFHEAYHAGQAGMLRRILGHQGVAG